MYFGFLFESLLDRPMRSSINVDRPIKICHVSATCKLQSASKNARTNQSLTRGSGWHVNQSGDDTCRFLPRGMSRRLQNDVHQSAIDTCHMCHVAVRSTPVGPSTGVVGTHLPTHQPPPTHPGVFGKFPGVLESSRDVRGTSGCFREVPRVFGKFRVFLGSSLGVLGIPRAGTGVLLCQSKTLNFRPMFHAEPAGIRSASLRSRVRNRIFWNLNLKVILIIY
jgi:hypothetical protein